jgi:hypothetical protein
MCAPVLLARTTACKRSRGEPRGAEGTSRALAVHLQVQQAERHAVQRLQPITEAIALPACRTHRGTVAPWHGGVGWDRLGRTTVAIASTL